MLPEAVAVRHWLVMSHSVNMCVNPSTLENLTTTIDFTRKLDWYNTSLRLQPFPLLHCECRGDSMTNGVVMRGTLFSDCRTGVHPDSSSIWGNVLEDQKQRAGPRMCQI